MSIFKNDRFLGSNSFTDQNPSTLDLIKYNGSHLTFKNYFENINAFEVSEATVGTPDGLVRQRTDDLFSGGTTIYDPATNPKIYVDQRRSYVRLTSTIAGAEFQTPAGAVNWDLSGYNYVVLPMRSTGDAQVVTVRLYSGADYIEKTVTMSGTAGTYQNVIVDLFNDMVVGAFDPTAIDSIGIVGANAGESVEVAMAYAVFTLNEIIGSRLTYKFVCIDNFDFTRNLETDDIKCGNVTVGKVATDDSVDLTMTVKEYNPELFAAAGSTSVSKGTTFLPAVSANVTPAGGTVTMAPNMIIDQFMKADGTCVAPVCITDAGDVPKLGNNDFYYDPATGVVSFGDSDLNGAELTPCIKEEVTADCIEVKALELGYQGRLVVQRTTKEGKIWSYEFTNVQIESAGFSGFDDTGDDVDVTMTANPDNNGVLYRIYHR